MFKVIEEIKKDNYTKFVIEPLDSGFGHTLGNSLRRVLLTSLEGSAVTSVKIEGVSHQFSTITGVVEDVIEILLNIKKIRVKVFSDAPVRLKLQATGKKVVKVSDLEISGDGEVTSPDQVIATLTTPKSKLNIDMMAEKGKGYSVSEDRKSGEIGFIPVDALFSPIISVNYGVDATRVGRRTDFDKLTLEVTSDGTVAPIDALNQAAKLLSDSFKQIYEPTEEAVEQQPQATISEDVLKMSVEELDLPVRITNALRAIDINSVEDLLKVPRAHLLKVKNLGAKSLGLISEKLGERGLSLSEA